MQKKVKENLFKEIKELDEKYFNLKDKINCEKAQGNLSKLYNLKCEFDETFDQFFDDVELRKKYNDWDYEEDCIKFEKSNDDLLEELDEEDLKKYIDFFKDYILELEEELDELKTEEDH